MRKAARSGVELAALFIALSTLQPFNPSTFQPFNPSTFQPFNLSTSYVFTLDISTIASNRNTPFIDHAASSGVMISLQPSAFMIWVPVR